VDEGWCRCGAGCGATDALRSGGIDVVTLGTATARLVDPVSVTGLHDFRMRIMCQFTNSYLLASGDDGSLFTVDRYDEPFE
jgi:hypothetical protein